MKKVKLLYNPFSGNKTFRFDLDVCIGIFQEAGYEVHPYRTMIPGDIDAHIAQMDRDYDIVVASGGDGTVNIVLNALMHNHLQIPLGIIPSGTANDFATFLGLKTADVSDACHAIVENEAQLIDIGVVNDDIYFINVCAGGLLTNVSQTVDKNVKNALGNLSYYLKGMEQLPNFHKIPFRITTSSGSQEVDMYLYMILNSAGTGGFTKLSPYASVTDGIFELIGIRANSILDFPSILLRLVAGDHLSDEKNILYIRDNYFKIECLDQHFQIMESSIDGELGPKMPFTVRVLPKAYPVFGRFHQEHKSRLRNKSFKNKTQGQELKP